MQRAVSLDRGTRRFGVALFVSALLTSSVVSAQEPAPASSTLERIQSSGKLTICYYSDAAPMSYQEGGKAQGYAVALCDEVVADTQETSLKLPGLTTGGRSGGRQGRFSALREGGSTCCAVLGADAVAREGSELSIPILISGTAVLAHGCAADFRDALEGGRS
jgi:ABC-type amino acid transport substrate-binding protein